MASDANTTRPAGTLVRPQRFPYRSMYSETDACGFTVNRSDLRIALALEGWMYVISTTAAGFAKSNAASNPTRISIVAESLSVSGAVAYGSNRRSETKRRRLL